MKFAGLVLAGGRSSRMGGGDKTLLQLGDRPLMAHVLERLRRQVEAMAISANGEVGRFAEFGFAVLSDTIPGFAGPLAGVLAGIDWATRMGHPALITVAGDTPFFPTDLVARLTEAGGASQISVAYSLGRPHPVFALWPTDLRPDLEAFLLSGQRRVMDFATEHDAVPVEFTWDAGCADPFFNINTPEDLREAERRLELGA